MKPSPLQLSELSQLLFTTAQRAALKRLVTGKANRVVVDGLAGSAAAMMFTALPKGATPYLIIANDLDEAGYIYHDLCQLTSEAQVLLFPSGYKRDIKYGQVDAPQEILRTEVLNRWHTDGDLRWVVTYPEALAEKVVPRESIEKSTVTLEVGKEEDLTQVSVRLRELGFQEVDYVYEPGQFSVRGSILDVYSYSNEYPYRIDFFGDEIDSVRTFNVETQLSQERLQSVSIINNTSMQAAGAGVSLLDFVGTDVTLLVRDINWLIQRVEAIGKETMSQSAIEAQECDSEAMLKVVDVPQFLTTLNAMRRLEFYYGESLATGNAKLSLHCSPQGIYHKNFDLISQSFTDFLERGYTLYILSDSAKQIERLRVIFDDRHDEIVFTPVNRTLHEGFVNDERKMCVFTDHQIFDRFHKYNLKSERARSGKLALSLKELNQIETGDFIVHEDHGIGRFEGLLRTRLNGTMQEMIKLSYLNGDVIFVSIHALHKLSKYRGKEGVPPKLSKLGTGKWERIKSRTKGRLKDIARDLIKLYAQRREEKGFALSPDG